MITSCLSLSMSFAKSACTLNISVKVSPPRRHHRVTGWRGEGGDTFILLKVTIAEEGGNILTPLKLLSPSPKRPDECGRLT